MQLSEYISRSGSLPCFCLSEYENHVASNKIYEFNIGHDYIKSAPICEQYSKYLKLLGVPTLLNYGLSVMIVI